MDDRAFEQALGELRAGGLGTRDAEEHKRARERAQTAAEAQSLAAAIAPGGPLFATYAKAAGITPQQVPTGRKKPKYRFLGPKVQVLCSCWTVIPRVFSGRDRGAGEGVGLWVDTEGIFWFGMSPVTRLDEIQSWPTYWPHIDDQMLADVLRNAGQHGH
ncbi:MAG: hypothetical protein M3071_12130 [Actinomycetota bacterium]|nr:hypothetical protein [Actinomycetota bacterium]